MEIQFGIFIYILDLLFYVMKLCVEARRESGAFSKKAAGLSRQFLRYQIYSIGVIRLCTAVISGVRGGGESSSLLLYVQILMTEALLFLCFLPIRPQELAGLVVNGKRKLNGTETEQDERSFLEQMEKEIGWIWNLCLFFQMLLMIFALTLPLYLSFAVVCGLFLIFFVSEYAYCQYQKTTVLAKQEAVQRLREQKEHSYLKSVDEQYQQTRELWHDLKNQLGVLEILAKDHRYEELEEYLDSFQKDAEARMLPIRSGSSAVDAILSRKIYQAKREDISVTVEVCPLSNLRDAANDFCAVLGNLLDNAIEACEKSENGRFIRISIRRQEAFYDIRVVNSVPEVRSEAMSVYGDSGAEALFSVKQDKGVQEAGSGKMDHGDRKLASAKKDRENVVGHGLGLRSVERIAHRYGGSLAVNRESGVFTAVVRMEFGV
ncbi:MAG: ATP-binding protein [Lachnospiraceae bacterium]|nr:ATP-binding protein [Lachnospiraceae bacterium]